MTASAVDPLELHRSIDRAAWLLPSAAVRVARALVGKIRNATASWPPSERDPWGVTVAELARIAGMSPEHARRSLRVLEAAGLLETTRRPWQTNYYRLVDAAWQRAAAWVTDQIDQLKTERPRTIPLPSPGEVAQRGLAWLCGAEEAAGEGLPPRRPGGVESGRRTSPPPAWARQAAACAPGDLQPAAVEDLVRTVAERIVPGCPVADRNRSRREILAWWAEEGHPSPERMAARAAAVGQALEASPALAHLQQPRGRFRRRRPVADDLRAILRRRGEILAVLDAPSAPKETAEPPPSGELLCPGGSGPPVAASPPEIWWQQALEGTRSALEASDLPPALVDHLVAGLGRPEIDADGRVRVQVPDRGAAGMLAPVLGRVSADLEGWPVLLVWGGG